MNDEEETYLILLLSDSNLPTGAFVASSGLESYLSHGFAGKSDGITIFLGDNLASYTRSALPFVSDAHIVFTSFLNSEETTLEVVMSQLSALDDLYHAMSPNHVTRRASKSQGVALLTLYSKGFSDPQSKAVKSDAAIAVDKYKLLVRRGDTEGHLPICWGILTAGLGLSLGNSASNSS